MPLYGTPQVVNPTLRSQGNQVAGWVDQAAQQIPALNPAPAQLPPQANPAAVAAVQRHMARGGDPFKGQQGQGAPITTMPIVPKVRGIEQPDQVPTGVMPMNPNNDKVQGIPPNIGSQHANNLAAWQAYKPQIQDWRASQPNTQGMTDEQRLAAVRGWFGSRPASPFRQHGPLGPQPAAPTWPGSRDNVRPVTPPAGFAATPNPIPGVKY